jgi:transcriptional regulator with PAS, ATPase and Fis domain
MKGMNSGPPPEEETLRQALRALETFAGPMALLDAQARVLALGAEAQELLEGRVSLGQRFQEAFPKEAEEELRAALRSQRELVLTPGGPEARRRPRALRLRATALAEGGRGTGWAVLLAPCQVDPSSREELFHGLWTQDPRMRRLFRIIEKAARTEASVLVRGESGTGKELVANALHVLSPRSRGPFRAINCAALSPSLLESELFGHVRGAFTGAVRDSPGHFRLAQGGTLFLDEVAELPLELQAKLLRVLETRTVIPVGGRESVAVDVRIVAATHRALRREVEQGRFRADLMYRLRVVPIYLPPLRERQGDVEALTWHFLDEFNQRGERVIEAVDAEAMEALTAYAWPGNVRELRNVIEYAFAVGEGPILGLADLTPELRGEPPPDETAATDSSERRRIEQALRAAGGKRALAAERLGMSRSTLWRKLRELRLA